MSKNRWVLIGGGAAVAIVAAVIAVVLTMLLPDASRPGETTARFIPSSAPVYVSVNLRPGMSQIDLAREFFSLLQTDDFLDVRHDLQEQVEDETGIHFLDDITSWLGFDVSLVLLDAGPENPEWVLLAQIGDRDSAFDFVGDLLSYLEEGLFTKFDRDDHRGSDLWLAEDDTLALGITDEYLLVAGREATITDMVDNLESPPSRPLAEDQAFIAARKSVAKSRVMFMYIQAEAISDTFQDVLAPFSDQSGEIAGPRDNIPEYLAASASFVSNGIRLDLVAESSSKAAVSVPMNEVTSPGVLPADTFLLFSGVGLHQIWETFRESLDLDPAAGEEFEQALEDFEEQTGIDVERDILDSLSGEVAIALLPSDISIDLDGEPLSGAIEVLALAGLKDTQGIEGALESIEELIEDAGLEVDRTSLGDYEVVAPKLDDLGDPGLNDFLEDYDLGYVVTDDWVVAGSTFDSLERFHSAMTGATDSLSSATEFARFMDVAPAPLHALMYADLAGIFEMVEGALNGDTLSVYTDEVQPFLEPFNAFIAAGSVTDEEMRLTMVLTLKK